MLHGQDRAGEKVREEVEEPKGLQSHANKSPPGGCQYRATRDEVNLAHALLET